MEHRTRQCKPDNCPFKDYKGVRKDKSIFIADIPLKERYKYIDPEQDINHPCMKVMGHPKNKLENPMEAQIAVLSNHMIELTNQLNELTRKLKNLNIQ